MISREPIFSIRCELANILDLGPAPFGHRRVVNILGGPVTGARLSGRVLPGGADWQIVAADGSIDVHARYTIESDAGALIQVDSKGVRHGPVEPGGGPLLLGSVDLQQGDHDLLVEALGALELEPRPRE